VSSSFSLVKAILEPPKYRSGVAATVEFLDSGMLSWPIFTEAVASQNIVLITEGRSHSHNGHQNRNTSGVIGNGKMGKE
jgi:hypothetical protein